MYPPFANSVDTDQLDSEEANWSGAVLFIIQYVKFYQQPGSSNQIGWKLEVGMAFFFSMTRVNSTNWPPDGVSKSAGWMANSAGINQTAASAL